jgi:DAK2 domain fusion protein YloV
LSKRFINGTDFTGMVFQGADRLNRHAEYVNALNVFPVPDGDTGTNMNLTLTAGADELRDKPSSAIGKASEALSKGLLMGARGNSGVILSQLFRGFARSVAGLEQVDSIQFAAALQQGVDMAYKAVVKPVEGTILTVAREAAKHAVSIARRTVDMEALMQEVCDKARESLLRTPDLLPILKQVGVVDSGGQGLLYIYEGFMQSLSGDAGAAGAEGLLQPVMADPVYIPSAAPLAARTRSQAGAAQSRLATEDIEFLYDMEFFIKRKLGQHAKLPFNEDFFTRSLAKDGDSIVVIADDDIIKVHVHSRKPGDVLNLALPFGELTDIRILNMREQHRDLLEEDNPIHYKTTGDRVHIAANVADDTSLAAPEVLTGGTSVLSVPPENVHERAPYGIIAVATGEGIASIFLDNNVDVTLSGGQTMNPSTEDFVQAIESLSVDHIFLLPNNGNVILAAQQAAELSERKITVIPTKTIPQGLAALLAFKENERPERNEEAMGKAIQQVKSGGVTASVRDTVMNGLTIREGDFIGIEEKQIVISHESLQQACRGLLSKMIGDEGELLTILTGADALENDTAELAEWVNGEFPDVELEVHPGGQPLYPYLFAVE